jgi:integrase
MTKLPKYVSVRKGSLHYQRQYPTKLKHLCQTTAFSRPLGLQIDDSDSDQITKAALECSEAYKRHLTLVSNSDPDALSATDKDKAVVEFLRKRGLNKGQFVRVAKDSAIAAQEEEEGRQLQMAGYDYADWKIPEFDDVMDKQARGIPLTVKDTIVGDAYMSLIRKAETKPKTLGSLWPAYCKAKGIDVNERVGKKYTRYWERWYHLAGDCIIGPLTLDHIHAGLDAYVEERESTGKVASSSIRRELATIVACLNKANKKHRFNWRIILPDIIETPAKSRHPLEPHQQHELIKAVLTGNIKPEQGVIILLCLQGGMMVSEIKRLLPDDYALDAVVPHLKIINETKKEDRKRIVPLVLGVDLIKKHLAATVQWLNSTTESGPSYSVKVSMRKALDSKDTSPHCLRHTLKINAQNAGVSVLTLASIAGWHDPQRKLSKHLLRYGSTGISKDAMVLKLRDDSLLIHKELIVLEQSLKANSNVLAFG